VQLEQGISLISFEKEIITDKLKGFYSAVKSIIGSHGLVEKLVQEFNTLYPEIQKIIKDNELIIGAFPIKAFEIDKLMTRNLELTEITSDMNSQKDKTIKNLKEAYLALKKELEIYKEENEKLKLSLESADKMYQDLLDEFKKFRKRSKVKNYSDSINEERLCKNCQKYFKESENFYWSCRTHSSPIVENTYWCCGKTGKEAGGCIVSKHISKEDIIKDDEYQNITDIKFCPVFYI
jgi:chromosome segregation ATPase